jgi:hypothetical protein
MTKSSLVGGAYPARRPRESAWRDTPRLSVGPAFTVLLMLSLGLWWVISIAVSSLVFG